MSGDDVFVEVEIGGAEHALLRRSGLDLTRLPMLLADLHRDLDVGAEITLRIILPGAPSGEGEIAVRVEDVVLGAGFVEVGVEVGNEVGGRAEIHAAATNARSLADTIGPGMSVLVCGLNPSLHAADAGVGFVTPGNRFWPAALEVGLVTRDRDPVHALATHGVGMTDLVKRATTKANELDRQEYRLGLDRLDRLCTWLTPRAVCLVGLAGWREATDRKATTGWQDRPIGGRPTYVMPSTSGLNASSRPADFVDHLRQLLGGPAG